VVLDIVQNSKIVSIKIQKERTKEQAHQESKAS
jgi:hypothetical protein